MIKSEIKNIEPVQSEYNFNNQANELQIKADKSVSDISVPVQNIKIMNKRHTSFVENDKTKMQLSWKNITIIAPPKKSFCKRSPPDAKGYTILGNTHFINFVC